MTLNFALCEREFSVISSMLGKIGFLFTNWNGAFSSSVGRIGKFFGAFSTVLCCLNIVLTMRSSKEWNEITLIRPPTPTTSNACSSESSIAANSSFTAIRIAWKILLAGCPPFRLAAAETEENFEELAEHIIDFGF